MGTSGIETLAQRGFVLLTSSFLKTTVVHTARYVMVLLPLGCADKECKADPPPSSYEVDGAIRAPEVSDWVNSDGELTQACPIYCSFMPPEWVVGCRFVEVVSLEDYGWTEDEIESFYDKWGLGGSGGQGGTSGEHRGPGVVKAVCSIDDPGEDLADCD